MRPIIHALVHRLAEADARQAPSDFEYCRLIDLSDEARSRCDGRDVLAADMYLRGYARSMDEAEEIAR